MVARKRQENEKAGPAPAAGTAEIAEVKSVRPARGKNSPRRSAFRPSG
jgi:hypothetical protein